MAWAPVGLLCRDGPAPGARTLFLWGVLAVPRLQGMWVKDLAVHLARMGGEECVPSAAGPSCQTRVRPACRAVPVRLCSELHKGPSSEDRARRRAGSAFPTAAETAAGRAQAPAFNGH